MLNLVKINALEVLDMKAKDNGEELVDILKVSSDLSVDTSRQYSQRLSSSISLLRRGVVQKLLSAQKHLPDGIVFKVIEGYRPITVQKIIFERHLKFLKNRYPNWSYQQLKDKAAEFVAPPDINSPHSTGGACDLTLIDKDGKELDMGTSLNDGYSDNVHTDSPNISQKARQNRKLLINALSKEGFVNYPAEWWHWSYGDRYWAFVKKEPFAIYESIVE